MGRICRDDLRYTDDVIATLQADLPVAYVADILNIPMKDVPYHRDEVHGVSHNGRVLDIPTEDKPKTPTVKQKVKAGSLIDSMDRNWLLEHTYQEIAAQLELSTLAVIQHCWRYKIITASSKPQSPSYVDTVMRQKPEWLAVRSYRQISDELGIPYASVMDICSRHALETLSRRAPRYRHESRVDRSPVSKRHATTAVILSQSAEWLAVRSYQQISDELGVPYDHVRIACSRHNIVTASTRKWVRMWKRND